MNIRPLTIVISSCDAYGDLWPFFFYFFFRYFKEDQAKVYLIANYRRYNDQRVKTICVGEDRQWSDNLSIALKQVDDPYVLYLQDDYFLRASANINALIDARDFIERQKGQYLSFRFRGDISAAKSKANEKKFVELHPSFTSRMVDLQTAFWSKESLLNLTGSGWSPWDAESKLNKKAMSNPKGYYAHVVEQCELMPYIQAIKGKFWMPEGADFMDQSGLTWRRFSPRPYPPQGQDFTRKTYRSMLKRQLMIKEWFRKKFRINLIVQPLEKTIAKQL